MSLSIIEGALVVDNFGEIRITEDGLLCVFDLIQVCAEYKGGISKYRAWTQLTESNPEVLSSVIKHRFEGRGQKEVPVVDKATALVIIGLLPGATGQKYRQLAANLVLSYLESPAALAENAIARTEVVEPEKLESLAKQIEAAQNRVKGVKARKDYTTMVQEQGKHEFWRATDTVYDAMIGLRAKDIKRLATGKEKAKGSARDYLKDHAITMLKLVEGLAASVAEDTGEDVVELATACAAQSSANLSKVFKDKLTDFREKPFSPDKARKVVEKHQNIN